MNAGGLQGTTGLHSLSTLQHSTVGEENDRVWSQPWKAGRGESCLWITTLKVPQSEEIHELQSNITQAKTCSALAWYKRKGLRGGRSHTLFLVKISYQIISGLIIYVRLRPNNLHVTEPHHYPSKLYPSQPPARIYASSSLRPQIYLVREESQSLLSPNTDMAFAFLKKGSVALPKQFKNNRPSKHRAHPMGSLQPYHSSCMHMLTQTFHSHIFPSSP